MFSLDSALIRRQLDRVLETVVLHPLMALCEALLPKWVERVYVLFVFGFFSYPFGLTLALANSLLLYLAWDEPWIPQAQYVNIFWICYGILGCCMARFLINNSDWLEETEFVRGYRNAAAAAEARSNHQEEQIVGTAAEIA
ncbi:MAG TPA: hypothetical protein VD998_04200 [Verrucomicrobiae bacterium]|nr:hypothetical protein [Verrucomicrobiae bacterium]